MRKPVDLTAEQTQGLPCGMRLRVYPSDAQRFRASNWLFQAHRFRNEAVEFLNTRRQARAIWMRQHPKLLAYDGLPEELRGSDENACSVWLTERLEAARDLVRRHGGISCHKKERLCSRCVLVLQ